MRHRHHLRHLLVMMVCFILITLGFSWLYAQDVPPPPTDASGLDAVVGTPEPLPTRPARPAPSQVIPGARTALNLYFSSLPQGGVGLLEVTGEQVTAATATWMGSFVDFFTVEGQGLFGLLSVNFEQNPRQDYPLSVTASFADGTRETLTAQISVVLGGFIRQEVVIPPDKGFLLDVETERAELARLESIFATITPERRWDDTGFIMPIPSALTSPFGAFRVFNSTLNTRHTGWDIRCTTGTPVFASASGEVVYAGNLPIRGQHVIIDHGYGIYSGYSHLSVTYVTRGQTVTREQVIGMTGSTGRTSGPHFHWEMAVNGQWIDSVEFLRTWIP